MIIINKNELDSDLVHDINLELVEELIGSKLI